MAARWPGRRSREAASSTSAGSAVNGRVRTGTPVTRVREEPDGTVVVATAAGEERHDYAVLAAHADETLALLERPTPRQTEILGKVRYSSTRAVLHTDPSSMPPRRERWQSWNYGVKTVDGSPRTWVAYYMNALQGFTARRDYFVTLDSPIAPRDELVVRELPFAGGARVERWAGPGTSPGDPGDPGGQESCGIRPPPRRGP
ncbi:FAD-dependent oxidoreductase [Streptomyces sp. NPDC002306]